MRVEDIDGELGSLLRAGLQLDREQEDALWSEFRMRQARETEAWAAFAAAMVMAGRRLGMVLKAHARLDFYPTVSARRRT